MRDAVIVSTARTGIGKAGRGSLNLTHGATMGGRVADVAVERAGIDPALVEDLQARGVLWREHRFEHSYPHCWRHKTPIIFRATTQWFIGMENRKDESEPTLRWIAERAVDECERAALAVQRTVEPLERVLARRRVVTVVHAGCDHVIAVGPRREAARAGLLRQPACPPAGPRRSAPGGGPPARW